MTTSDSIMLAERKDNRVHAATVSWVQLNRHLADNERKKNGDIEQDYTTADSEMLTILSAK